MAEESKMEPKMEPKPFAMESAPASSTSGEAKIDLLMDVPLNVRVELGRTRMYVEDILKLGDGAVVAAQSGVSKSIGPGEQVFGSPAQPIKQAFRNNAHIQRLDHYADLIKDLKKRVEELEKKKH